MNALRRLLQSSALLGLAALGARAVAQTQSYVTKTKTINAAVLLVDADRPQTGTTPLTGGGPYRYPQTAAPFAFYNLDQAKTIKPTGWTFTNPFAPGVVTDEIHDRYVEIYNSTTSSSLPAVGDLIGKRSGPYWTVRLSQLSETQISDYNLLLIAPKYFLALTPLERERLRRFVDGGGVLWVDLLGTDTSPSSGGFGNGAGFDAADNLPFALVPQAGVGNPYRDLTSPVIDGPKHVTDNDLGFLNPGTLAIGPVVANGTFNNLLSLSGEYFRYRNVASITDSMNNKTLPVIAEARLGDGAIVVTARGAAEMLNQGSAQVLFGDTTNSNVGYRALDATPPQNARAQAAARLAVNIASMGGNFNQPGGGTHNTSSANADPGSPVLTRFEADPAKNGAYGPGGVINGSSGPNGTPVSYKGFLVETIGNRIVVYDAVPGRDLDGDGDPDDGISLASGVTDDTLRDTSVGKPLDLVWVSDDLGSQLSAPVCASVPEAGGMADQILATDANGNLHVFPLVKFATSNFRAIGGIYLEGAGNPGLKIAPPPVLAPTDKDSQHAPTVYDNLAYMTDSVGGVGRVWVVDLSTRTRLASPNPGTDWYVGGATTTGNPLPTFTASPTIGYIPASDSPGGTDRVLYAPGVFGSNSQPGFVSLWLGAKGETPATVTGDGSNLTLVTHAGATSQLPIYYPPSGGTAAQKQLAPHLTILQNGLPVDASTYVTAGPNLGAAAGTLSYSSTLTDAQIQSLNLTFLVDYTIDWGNSPSTLTGQIERGRILLPVLKSPAVDASKRILGPIAMTTRGTLHMLEGTPNIPTGANGSDSYFAIREDAGLRGQFRVVSRFTLYNQYNQTFGGSPTGNQVPAVLTDADQVQFVAPLPGGNHISDLATFKGFRFAGGIALRNGIAYAPINAFRSGTAFPFPINVAMIAAFRAEPETAELRLGVDASAAPRIIQTDWARSYPGAIVTQPTQSSLAGNQLTVDAENGVVRIENLATTVRGEITDCISESQPIGVSNGTLASYTFRQPDAVGDRWSPLLWFGLWNGGTATGAPLVAGNSLFIPAQSALPNILATPPTFANSGVLWSVDADAPTTGPYAVTLPNRPWIVQQAQLGGTPGPDYASPYFRMPQNRGVQNFADYKIRLKQTVLGSSTRVNGVGGGDGVVAAWTDAGVYGLSRADFTVCDEGRLLRIDSAGNPVANAFGGKFSGIGNGGSAVNTRTLVRPVKAYPVGTNETLVVDAGANRIMRIDEDGTVLRSLDKILVDPAYKPANFRSGESLAFKDPRDVATWEGYVKKADNALWQPGNGDLEYWVHYLVADAGNGRLVELVDRFTVPDTTTGVVGAPVTIDEYDPELKDNAGNPVKSTVAQVGVLVWQSPSLEQTSSVGDYYNSVSRVLIGAPNSLRYVFVSGVSRTRPTRASAGLDNPAAPTGGVPSGGGGGAVVVFDPIGGTRVFDRFQRPNLATSQFFQPNTLNSTVGTFGTATRANTPAQSSRPFTGIQAVSASTGLSGGLASARVMVTDADAVYEFNLDANLLGDASKDPTLNGLLQPDWMIDEAAFTALRFSQDNSGTVTLGNNPLFFRPAYARRLDSGEVLIVNGYQGLMRDGQTAYSGEVTLLDGSSNGQTGYSLSTTRSDGTPVLNLGFDAGSLHFELPPLTGIRRLVSPVFADRR